MSEIRSDLKANLGRTGLASTIYGWFMSPGFKAVTLYRISRRFRSGGPFGKALSKIAWRWSVSATGCYLSPLADIGPGLSLPHAVGVVVGEGVRVGAGVTLYQHVTIGRARNNEASYPTIGDNVTVYAGAVVVGAIEVGSQAVIAANSVVARHVPEATLAAGAPAEIKSRRSRA